MPYITKESRENLEYNGIPYISNGGELQYMIAAIIDQHLIDKANQSKVRYKDLEEIMGALAGAQQEFYRMVVSQYEDKKIEENGPVYCTELYL